MDTIPCLCKDDCYDIVLFHVVMLMASGTSLVITWQQTPFFVFVFCPVTIGLSTYGQQQKWEMDAEGQPYYLEY
jgi:hypothetical protein